MSASVLLGREVSGISISPQAKIYERIDSPHFPTHNYFSFLDTLKKEIENNPEIEGFLIQIGCLVNKNLGLQSKDYKKLNNMRVFYLKDIKRESKLKKYYYLTESFSQGIDSNDVYLGRRVSYDNYEVLTPSKTDIGKAVFATAQLFFKDGMRQMGNYPVKDS